MDKSFYHSWLKDLGGHGLAGPSSILSLLQRQVFSPPNFLISLQLLFPAFRFSAFSSCASHLLEKPAGRLSAGFAPCLGYLKNYYL